MQLKLLLLAGLATAVTALSSPNGQRVDPKDDHAPITGDSEDGDGPILNTRAEYKEWNASGGCKTDWAGRCQSTCKKEAKAKGYSCDKITSNIWKEDCWLGWSVCDCVCKLK